MKKSQLTPLDNLVYFTKESLRSLSHDSDQTIATNIHRWLKSGDIIILKNGVFTTKTAFDYHKNLPGYREYLANVLCSSSYVSLEYVLSMNEVLTEASYPITSVTLKVGRIFQNKTGVYIYKKLKQSLFAGFETKQFLDLDYLVASKAKALFDYLYYKLPSLSHDLNSRNMAEELRLKLDNFNSTDWAKLKKYGRLSGNNKMQLLIINIIQYAPHY